ncbi:MAG: hypothetical protein AB7G28_18795 [Pirellulales bacterium]
MRRVIDASMVHGKFCGIIMTIPSIEDVGDLSFSEHIGFPFEFSAIDYIKFFKKPGVGISDVVNDPEPIRRALSRIGGFQVDESDESIVICWPDL